jgi:hypothetical protein
MNPPENNECWPQLLERLAEPFDERSVKWRAGPTTRDKKRAQALPYAEARVYEDRLNEVCPGAWHVDFAPWGATRLVCRLTIHGVTRASTGEAGDTDEKIAGTAAESQAFKRACSKFGLGRYFYDLPAPWVGYDPEKKRLTETPTLPAKYRPHQPPATLPAERVKAMAAELSKLGLTPAEQLELARAVTGRQATTLAQLTEAEALELWRRAKGRTQSTPINHVPQRPQPPQRAH